MGLFVRRWRRVTGVNGVILVKKKKRRRRSNDGNYRCALKSNVVRNRWRRTESREGSLFSSAFPSAAISTDVSTEWAIISTLKDTKYLSRWNAFKKCYIIGLQRSSQSSWYCHRRREAHRSWCKITMCVLAEMLRALMFVFSRHRLAARLKAARYTASLVFSVLTNQVIATSSQKELWEV